MVDGGTLAPVMGGSYLVAVGIRREAQRAGVNSKEIGCAVECYLADLFALGAQAWITRVVRDDHGSNAPMALVLVPIAWAVVGMLVVAVSGLAGTGIGAIVRHRRQGPPPPQAA